MPKGGDLVVSTFRKDTNLCISVGDTGYGIPKENLSRIFDPFFTTKKDGVGLGLSTANTAIEQHNGWIEYNKNIEKGSIFTVFLPFINEDKI